MRADEFRQVFDLPFNEATGFFRDKLNIPTERWDELEGKAHAKAFTSAGAMHADLLADLCKMTDKAIAGGMNIREFRQQFIPLVEKYGWQLKGGGPAWRADLIWRTNITTAYQAGRWRQFEEGGIEYLMYVHKDGQMHPRPAHVALDGKIFPRTSDFWKYNYPAQGFGCKCRAVASSKREYEQAAPERKRLPDGYRDMADKGWNYNVGLAAEGKGYEALTAKFESLPGDIARAWMRRFVTEPAFVRFIDGKIQGEFPVAVLQKADMALPGTEQQTIWLSDETLAAHVKKHPEVGVKDYALLPEIIAQGEIYQQNNERIICLWKGDRLYRAAVKTTRTRDRNYLLTLFTTKERAAYNEVRNRYERIR